MNRPRSALRVLVPPVLAIGVVAAAIGVRATTGAADLAALVLSGGIGLIALWALVDGVRRAAGGSTFLGTGRGIDRFAGMLQVLASVGFAIALLPNTVALLNALATLLG